MVPRRALFALSLLAGCAGPPPPDPSVADLVIRGALVRTMDEGRPIARALAVRSGRVVAVGEPSEVARWIGAGSRVLDLPPEACVLPGFVDAHGHVAGLGAAREGVDLVGTRSHEEMVERVRERAAALPKGSWVLGRGWDQNDWPEKRFPDHRPLSAAVPDHPVWLDRVDGHAGLANAAALSLAGIDRDTADPPGGKIHRFPDGSPTGVLVDAATSLVERHGERASREDLRRRLLEAQDACFEAGLVSVHDAGVGRETVEVYRELADEGRLRLRVYAMLAGASVPPETWPALRVVGHRGVLTVRSIKLVADGALGSRGAALGEDYADDAGNRGLLLLPEGRVEALARAALAADYQVNVHAIGDLANRLVLDAFEGVFGGRPRPELRWRIEHAQVVRPSDLARFARLGVIPSMQPTHCTSDMPWAPSRLGPERVPWAYAWRQFLDAGCRIAAGSDFPVESEDPRRGLYAAVTTRDEEGFPIEGYRPEERLTIEEALRAFTIDAAHAAFEEGERGSIAPGKAADLVVLERDPCTLAPRDLLRVRILRTIVAGETVFGG